MIHITVGQRNCLDRASPDTIRMGRGKLRRLGDLFSQIWRGIEKEPIQSIRADG
ncbi:hypothetical protein LBMAG20_16440 [Methylocystaceae bacterium]|jgi:hypothetical protein|nr:hypothetical protein LBMAG20_16440 [Methylocystaceae bacterium]